MVSIYVLKDPDSKEIRYVGKTIDPKRRLSQHIKDSQRRTAHVQCWILSLLSQGKNPVIEVIDEVPDDLWESAEMGYIHLYRSRGTRLTNIGIGGDGGTFTAEVRKKFSVLRLGRKFSDVTKKRMSLSKVGKPNYNWLGKKHSEASKEKMRLAHLGRKQTLEHVSKRRASLMEKNTSRYFQILDLRSQGKTFLEIGNFLSLSRSTVSQFLSRRSI